ncbi:MAG: tetratricopeptide repeat protein [Pararobbsia sp.]
MAASARAAPRLAGTPVSNRFAPRQARTPPCATSPSLGPLSENGARIALGRALCADARPSEAVAEFERVAAAAPRAASAFAWLGDALAQAKRFQEALARLNEAIALDPVLRPARIRASAKRSPSWAARPRALAPLRRAVDLDTGAARRGSRSRWSSCGSASSRRRWAGSNRALEIEPGCAPAFRHMGRTLAALRCDKEALACFRAARKLHHDWAEAWLDEAGLLLRGGEYRAGWRAYENREFARRLATVIPPVWNGDDGVAGESLLLISEQGLGDTLQFFPLRAPRGRARRGGHRRSAAVAAQPARAKRGGTGVTVIPRGAPLPPCTRQNSLISMPYALQADGETYGEPMPYVFALDARVALWLERLDAAWASADRRRARRARARRLSGPPIEPWPTAQTQTPARARTPPSRPRLRVGLVVSGNPLFLSDPGAFDAARARLAAAGPRGHPVGHRPARAARNADAPTLRAHPAVWFCGKALRDFDDTAGLLASLDLVISVDNRRGPPRRRDGAPRLAAAAVLRRLALAARPPRHAVVPERDAVPPARAAGLANCDRRGFITRSIRGRRRESHDLPEAPTGREARRHRPRRHAAIDRLKRGRSRRS